MIGVNVTFVPDQVVSPDLQGMHNRCKLKVVGQVALLMVLQLSGCISYDSPTLHQNTTKSLSRGITIDHEVFLDARQGKHRSSGELLFQGLEALLVLGRPLKLVGLLQQVGHGLGCLGEILNETAIVTSQPKKNADISHIEGLLPLFHSLNLGGINSNSLSSENMAEKGDFF
jgi:hypothetical protein